MQLGYTQEQNSRFIMKTRSRREVKDHKQQFMERKWCKHVIRRTKDMERFKLEGEER